jgi:hypothetical protein
MASRGSSTVVVKIIVRRAGKCKEYFAAEPTQGQMRRQKNPRVACPGTEEEENRKRLPVVTFYSFRINGLAIDSNK